MAAKGTKVTETEREKMWQLYQQLGTYKAVAKKMRRSPDTVSRHVHEYEAAVGAVSIVINAKKK